MTANIITGLRIVLSLFLPFSGAFTPAFYCLYILCGLSDMTDGTIARRMHTVSRAGALFDSIADIVFLASCAVTILPAVQLPLRAIVCAAIIALIRVSNLIISLCLHGRIILMHTAANKVTGFLLFLMPLALPLTGTDIGAAAVCASALFASVQEGVKIVRTKRPYRM